MGYNKTELITLGGLVCVLVVGLMLVVPQLVGRLGGERGVDAGELVLELPTEKEQDREHDSESKQENGSEGMTPHIPTQAQRTPGQAMVSGPEGPSIYVYITGAVHDPAVVTVPAGTRLFKALEAVGGPLDTAAVQFINLAQQVEDGQMVYIPTIAELKSGHTKEGLALEGLVCGADSHPDSSAGSSGELSAGASTRVNINTANYEELLSLPGIGETLARRIIAFRQQAGGFSKVAELAMVSGIGAATLEELQHYVVIH